MSLGSSIILAQGGVTSTAPTAEGMQTGFTSSESGASPIPMLAFVHQDPNSSWTFGMGLLGIGGSQVNFSADPNNPILAPQGSNPYGLPSFGQLSSGVDILQIVPVLSYQWTDQLSVGFGPTITMGKIVSNPFYLGPPISTGSGGAPIFDSGTGTRWSWGGGFQAGLYYLTKNDWHLGASFKSPQWFEPFRYNCETASGEPMHIEFDADLPLIVSLGVAYSGIDRWTFASDLRWFDYGNTTGFSQGRKPSGVAKGLDWNSIMSLGLGVQYELTEQISVRFGYIFNEDQIDTMAVMGNVGSPLIIKHCLTMGASYAFADNWIIALSYAHLFRESITGPYTDSNHEAIADTAVTLEAEADSVAFEVTKRF